jgi:hypothetical protein
LEHWTDQAALARVTGVVIPAYFSATPSDEMVSRLLWMTLGDTHHYVPLGNVWVVVDGDPRTASLLEPLRQRLLAEQGATFHSLPLPENRGKLAALKEGVGALLAASPDVQYIAVRDGDGDHMAADIPPLVRVADYLARAYAHTDLIVIGARRSRHRPMGWVRGELEALLDRVTLDALAYALAREGRALNLRHCAEGAVPDLSSGYKVYGRRAAQRLFVDLQPQLETLSPADYWHYGPETVTVVEGVLAGTILAEVRRYTWDGQPTTSFGEFRQVALYGELLAWVYARLDIPLDVAAQFYDNYTPAMPLRTTGQGRELLDAVRAYALDKARVYRGKSGAIPPPMPMVPFV